MKKNKKNNLTKNTGFGFTQNNSNESTQRIHRFVSTKEQSLILKKIAAVGKLRAN